MNNIMPKDLWGRVEELWKYIQNNPKNALLATLLLLIFGGLLSSRIDSLGGYSTNVYTEFLSLFATVALLNELAKRRERQQHIDDLVQEAASPIQSVAVNAVTYLKRNGYLDVEDNQLCGEALDHANWSEAQLENVKLDEIDFREARLNHCNLRHCFMRKCNLSDAEMRYADLFSANLDLATLIRTDLHGSKLMYAKLSDCVIVDANFSGADLTGVDFSNSRLQDLVFDQETILPDGLPWKPGLSPAELNQRLGVSPIL